MSDLDRSKLSQNLHSSTLMNSQIPAFDTFYLKLEGYTEALELTVDRKLLLEERKFLFKELTENFIIDAKKKRLISEYDDVLVISENNWKLLNKEDPSVLVSKKTIIFGYSDIETLKEVKFENSAEKMSISGLNILDLNDQGHNDVERSQRDAKSKKPEDHITEKSEENVDVVKALVKCDDICDYKGQYYRAETAGLEPKVLTNSKGYMGNLSYKCGDLEKKDYDPKLPPPILIPLRNWTKTREIRFPERLEGVSIMKNGVQKVTDQDAIDSQKGILGEVAKRIAKAFFTGEGMVTMSLPVRIFEPVSTLQRIGYQFAGLPKYIKQADKIKDPVERIKLIISASLVGLTLTTSQRKPFNPYLGETQHSTYEDGSTIYMEHTVHHPPITNFLMYINGTKARLHGRIEHSACVGMNNLEISYRGTLNIDFSDGSSMSVYNPINKSNGTMYGDRTSTYIGQLNVDYPQYKLKAMIKFDKKPDEGRFNIKDRKDVISGMIYQYNPDKTRTMNKTKFDNVNDCFDGKKDFVSIVSKIAGSYMEACDFDGKQYWNNKTDKAYEQTYQENPLPSDFRWREDLTWLYHKNMNYAEAWKLELERVQRKDRTNRQEYIKANKIKASKINI